MYVKKSLVAPKRLACTVEVAIQSLVTDRKPRHALAQISQFILTEEKRICVPAAAEKRRRQLPIATGHILCGGAVDIGH